MTFGDTTSVDLHGRFLSACSKFEFFIAEVSSTNSKHENVEEYCFELSDLSKPLAASKQVRQEVGSLTPSLWPVLHSQWSRLFEAQRAYDQDNSASDNQRLLEKLSVSDDAKEKSSSKVVDADMQERKLALRQLCLSIARFTRNLVAQVEDNQVMAFQNEPIIRQLIHRYTTWIAMDDDDSFLLTQTLTQTLANMITANDELIDKFCDAELRQERGLLGRLLASPDARTVFATFVLVLNCIHGHEGRMRKFATTPLGIRICIALLDDMADLYDAEDGSDGSRAFDVGIFSRFIEGGFVPELYYKMVVADEVVTPHQTTLLKLIDSYLQSGRAGGGPELQQAHEIYQGLASLFAERFMTLSAHTQKVIRKSLGPASLHDAGTSGTKGTESNNNETSELTPQAASNPPLPPVELDVMLPKVCEALVLIAQCITALTLEMESIYGDNSSPVVKKLNEYFIGAPDTQGQGLVESLIELLRLLDLFLPRINFGKPVAVTPEPSGESNTSNPQQSALTADPTGFSYLKRDLVRLLGILCYEDKGVQDRTRICNGIQVVMNLCVVDERNPYLREHAIFTLRNLLKDNAENQALVNSIQPSGQWDEEGVLRDTRGAVRR